MTQIQRRFIRVVGAVLVEGEKVLVVRRPPQDRGGGFWEFPGGKIEDGESPRQALLREIEEELALSIRIEHDLGSRRHAYDSTDVDLQLFICRKIGGTLELREHDALEWVAPQDLKTESLLAADRPFVADIQEFFAKKS